jgi:site-specific DNA recombinase
MNKPDDTQKAVGIWIRVSTENQAKGDSPEHHEHRARCYAESRGWNVIEVYHLEAVSGKSVMEHPEAQRMLRDVRGGRIAGLIFSKLARLARNTKELLEFADIFRSLGADLISLQESIDTSTPAGRLFYTMIAAMAQWEREEIADRVAASMTVRAKLGRPLNGKAPFGYVWQDKKLVPHSEEAPIRKLIYDLYLDCRRKKMVARVLNERGYRTRDGSKWSDTSIERLVRDPTAKGQHRSNYTRRANGTREIKPETEWIWNDVEPIVSEDVWNRCNQLLTEKGAKYKQIGKRPVNLFSGVTFCECGRKMYVPSNTPKYVCLACRSKIPVDDLEAIFVEQLKGFFLSPTAVAEHLQLADEQTQEKEKLLGVLRAEHAKVNQEADRLYKLYQSDGLSGEAFVRFYKPLEQRQKELDNEIPRLEAEQDILKVNSLSSEQVLAEAHNLYGRWPSLEREEKQRIVESITERIVIGKDEVSVSLCSLPCSEETTKGQRQLPPPSPSTKTPTRM